MIAEQLFQEMKKRHLTTSRRGWSRAWAGRAQNWLCENREKPLPAEIALTVHRKLVWIAQDDLAEIVLQSLLADGLSGVTRSASREGTPLN